MTTTEATKATDVKATRTLTWRANTDDVSPTAGVLGIVTGRAADFYVVTEFPTGHDFRGFTLARPQGGEGYTVTCGRMGTSCSCPGAHYRGKCKHMDAVRKLIDLGKL